MDAIKLNMKVLESMVKTHKKLTSEYQILEHKDFSSSDVMVIDEDKLQAMERNMRARYDYLSLMRPIKADLTRRIRNLPASLDYKDDLVGDMHQAIMLFENILIIAQKEGYVTPAQYQELSKAMDVVNTCFVRTFNEFDFE